MRRTNIKSRNSSFLSLFFCLFFLLTLTINNVDAKLKNGPSDSLSEKKAKETVADAKKAGLDFSISRVFHLPQCLTDEDILDKTEMSKSELDRIRANTEQILKGTFQTSAAGVGFYTTVALSSSHKSQTDNPEQDKISSTPQREFEGHIIVETNQWESNNLASEVAALLIQDVLGYPTFLWEVPFGAVLNPYSRTALGWTHMDVENWESDDVEFFKYYVQEKQLTSLVDTQSYSARNGIYFPTFMVNQKKNKDKIMTSWQSLLDPEISEQFYAFDPKRYNKDPKARKAVVDTFFCKDTYCPDGFFIPPQCKKEPTECREYLAADPAFAVGVTEQMFTNLNFPFVIVYTGVVELWIEASKRIENKEPVLFFSWVPTPIVAQYDVTRLMLPEATASCFFNRTSDVTGPIDCDYGFDLLRSIAWGKLQNLAPSVFEFATRFSIPALGMQEIVDRFIEYDPKWMYVADNQEIVYHAACGWLKNNADIWNLWIPVPKESELQEFAVWAQALIIAVAVVCLVLFVCSAILIFFFRKRSIIRFSDPVFLWIMIFGATLATIGVILNVAPSPSETWSCQIVIWFICCGFTLFFATLFAKTLRLVWIFFQVEKVNANSRFMFNKRHLIYLLCGFLSIDIIVLGVWSGTDTLKAKEVTDEDKQLEYYILCRSSNDDAFIIALAVIKCLVIGVAAVMAFLARKLPNVLNESYYIFLTVYNVGFFTAIILPVTAVLSDDPEAALIVRCLGILFCACSSVLLIVAPKFYIIYKRKHGASSNDTVLDMSKTTNSGNSTSGGTTNKSKFTSSESDT